MADNKGNQDSCTPTSTSSNPDREFESQGQKPISTNRDDDTTTAGGRKGNFSDKERDSENQWSPGSTQSSDQ